MHRHAGKAVEKAQIGRAAGLRMINCLCNRRLKLRLCRPRFKSDGALCCTCCFLHNCMEEPLLGI